MSIRTKDTLGDLGELARDIAAYAQENVRDGYLIVQTARGEMPPGDHMRGGKIYTLPYTVPASRTSRTFRTDVVQTLGWKLIRWVEQSDWGRGCYMVDLTLAWDAYEPKGDQPELSVDVWCAPPFLTSRELPGCASLDRE